MGRRNFGFSDNFVAQHFQMELQEESVDFKSTLNYSAMYGMVVVVMSLIPLIFNLEGEWWFSIISFAANITALYYLLNTIKKEHYAGVISYGRIVKHGSLIASLSSILVGSLIYSYLKVIDGSVAARMLDLAYEEIEQLNLSDREIDQTMALYEQLFSPEGFATSSILSTVFFGVLISLVLGAVLKSK